VHGGENRPAALENPMSVDYLKANLRRERPRLVFTPAIVADIKSRLPADPVLRNMVEAVRLNAQKIPGKPLLTRRKVGRRLLGTSREMLYRVNMLGAVYLLDRDPEVLRRIDEEVRAVCGFSDWNPSHFLDVAEMSLAVALALDWTAGDLSASTEKLARRALIEKGVHPHKPGGKKRGPFYGDSNWNQVCNGGMVAAAIAIAEEDPALAARTIHRALEGMPNALKEYMPHGVYPEGSTYWGYGTGYSVITAAMFESAFGTDFGLFDFPGFKESAVFRVLCNAPSGWYYNFADCGDRRASNGDIMLAWFAAKTGNRAFFERERFLRPAGDMGTLSRHAGAALAWLSQYVEKGEEKAPPAWAGKGANPIVVFTGGDDDSHQYYFGGKGGRATVNHGNMDAGSFVFELNGVRWVIDMGNQGYHELEKTGFNLWSRAQNGDRWKLLTKNNFGHSTLTVNGEPFVVNGFAPLLDFGGGDRPEAVFDLTAVYGANVKKATRRFVKDSATSLLIEDRVRVSKATRELTWQLLTTAVCEDVDGGAVLKKNGEVLRVACLSHPRIALRVVPLYPPPLKLDRRIKGLKRIELRIPADAADRDGNITIRVRLYDSVAEAGAIRRE